MYEEIEFKLSVSPQTARRLLRYKGLGKVRKNRLRKRHLVSTYFDTPNHAFRKSGIVVRVRDDGEEKEQTVKVPFQGLAGFQNFREWTVPVEGDSPKLSMVKDPELALKFSRRHYDRYLHPVFTTDFKRQTLQIKTKGTEFELAVDQGIIHTEINGIRVEEPICEVEFELLSGDPGKMLDLAIELCEVYDMRPAHLTKAQRGYILASPALHPRPQKAPKVFLDEKMSVGEAFNFIVSGALDHMFANEIPALEGKAEGVHQTRVAMRRLRAALRAFKKILPYDKRKAFNGEFRWFQQRLAPARDWQVFLSETFPKIASREAETDEAFKRLRRVLLAERRLAVRDVASYLESRRYCRLILQFKRWVASLREEIGEEAFNQPIKPFARSVLRKTWRYFLEDSRPLSRLPSKDLHQVRKRGKNARYATQFFSSLWGGSDVKPFMKLMGDFQDHLGKANDAVVARHILVTVEPGKLDASLLHMVQNWSQSRILHCIRPAQPKWRKLHKLTPFWKS